ncbi:MAG: hypothetical protein IKD79_03190 [Oscillospiraceae bacterium]|nr:hypothetical protein [Oscillospiraceae bacterium]
MTKIIGFAILGLTAVYFLWGLLTRRYYQIEGGVVFPESFQDLAGMWIQIGMTVFIAVLHSLGTVLAGEYIPLLYDLIAVLLVILIKKFHWCVIPLLLHTVYLGLIGARLALSPAQFQDVVGWLSQWDSIRAYIAGGVLVFLLLFVHLRQRL